MNTNTNLPFLQSHSFPFFNRQTSNKDIHSDSFAGSSLKKSLFLSFGSRTNLKNKYLRKEQIEQTKQCCKRFFTFLFSHIGLSALLVGYVIVGGLMFKYLESSREIVVKNNMTKFRDELIRNIIRNITTKTIINIKVPVNETTNKYKNLTDLLNDILQPEIYKYTKEIIRYIQEEGWNGMDDPDILNWSHEGAFLYVITVITTIGYGHVAPKTDAGKLMTMLYALLGIPLTFLYLSNIGDYLADWFRFLYHKVCRKYCKFCCQRNNRNQSALRSRLKKTNAFPGLAGQMLKKERQNQINKSSNFLDKSLRQIRDKLSKFPLRKKVSDEETQSKFHQETSDNLSLSNIQNEQYICKSYGVARFLPSVKTVKQREALMMNCVSTHVPLINWRDIDRDLEIGSLENIPTITDSQDLITEPDMPSSDSNINQYVFQNKTPDDIVELQVSTCVSQEKQNALYKSLPYLSNAIESSPKISVIPNRSSSFTPDINFVTESIRQVSYVSVNNVIEIENEIKSTHKTVKIQTATVPISLSLAVIFIYIIFGSIIFTFWEDPSYLKWSYFCFITLSTIGFGDIVPGTKIDSDNPKEKLILVSIYVIIGLSVFAMCFKLMQEEVIAKIKRLGKKLGFWKNKVKNFKNHEKSSEMIFLQRSR